MFPKTGIIRLSIIAFLASTVALPANAQQQQPGSGAGAATPPPPPGAAADPLAAGRGGTGNTGAPMGNLPLSSSGTRGASLTPEEAAELEQRLEEEAEKQTQEIRKQAFDGAVDSVLPLKPEEIREMLEYFRESREAAETPITVPQAQVRIETIPLDPASMPSVVKTAPGHVTTLNILDVTGQPWPIRDVSWAGQFEVTPPEAGGHVLRITPLSAHGVGNISIQLVDLVTPITFSLQAGLDVSYYRFDARIPEMGPMANVPIIDRGGLTAVAGDTDLISFLEGVPPAEAKPMEVRGVDPRTRVWQIGSEYYIRTPLSLLSPAWNNSVKSSDGMNVYALNQASVLLLSDNGRMVQAYIASQEE